MYRAAATTETPAGRAPRVVVEGLWAAYDDAVALESLDLSLDAGRVYGLVGPNGAGKSTLMRCLAGLHPPLRGSVRVDGEVVTARAAVRTRVALMPDRPPAWDKLTAREQLSFVGRIDGLDEAGLPARVDAWLERVGLGGRGQHPVRALSLGQRQRLGLAQVMLREVPFVMLDEPANGMDPDARATLAAVLREAAGRGVTVLVSSHVLTELDAMCDAFVVLSGGRLSGAGTAQELHGAERGTVTVAVSLAGAAEAWSARAAEAVARVDGARLSQVNGSVLRVQVSEDDASRAALLRALMDAGLPVASFAAERPQISALYNQLSRRTTEA